MIDASDPGFERQLAVTDKVLAEIGANEVPRLRVFNKIDGVGDPVAQAEHTEMLRDKYPGCIVMSARLPEDVAQLHAAIVAFFQKDLAEAELFLPWSSQQLRGKIYTSCKVLEERADEVGALFRVLGEPETLKELAEQLGHPVQDDQADQTDAKPD